MPYFCDGKKDAYVYVFPGEDRQETILFKAPIDDPIDVEEIPGEDLYTNRHLFDFTYKSFRGSSLRTFSFTIGIDFGQNPGTPPTITWTLGGAYGFGYYYWYRTVNTSGTVYQGDGGFALDYQGHEPEETLEGSSPAGGEVIPGIPTWELTVSRDGSELLTKTYDEFPSNEVRCDDNPCPPGQSWCEERKCCCCDNIPEFAQAVREAIRS